MGGFSSKRYQLNDGKKKVGRTHKKRRKWKKKEALSDDGQVSGAVCNNLYNLGDPQSLVIANKGSTDNGPSLSDDGHVSGAVCNNLYNLGDPQSLVQYWGSTDTGPSLPVTRPTTDDRADCDKDNQSRQNNNDTNIDQHIVDQQTTGSDFVSSKQRNGGPKPEPGFEVVCDLDHRLSLVVPKSPSDVKVSEIITSTSYENIKIRGEEERQHVTSGQRNDTDSYVKLAESDKIKAEPGFEIVCDVTRQKSIVIPKAMTP